LRQPLLALLVANALVRGLRVVAPAAMPLPGRHRGTGSFGSVFEMQFEGQLAVVKRMPIADDSRAQSAHDELLAFGTVRHELLVPLLAVSWCETVTPGELWFVLPLYDGNTLLSMLSDPHRAHGLFHERGLQALAVVARAVHVLHAAGIVHRDVNLDNVLVRSAPPAAAAPALEFSIALADFGTVISARPLRIAPSFGTPLYMAPEVGKSFTSVVLQHPSQDVFSLGMAILRVILHQRLAAGSAVFWHLSSRELLDVEKAVNWALQAVRTVDALHQRRLIEGIVYAAHPACVVELSTLVLACLGGATLRPSADVVAQVLEQCALLTSRSTAQPQLLPLDLLQVFGLQPHVGRP
jgi:serine/threonine protein kinase